MEIGKIYSQSWKVFAQHWKFIIVVGIGTTILTYIVNKIAGAVSQEQATGAFLGIILNLIISNLIAVGWIKNYLAMGRGAEPSVDFFSQSTSKLPSYIAGTVALGILVILGLICFIFPGIYFAIRYQFVPTLLTDKEIGVRQAFKQGGEMTKDAMMDLTLLLLGNFFLVILGFLSFGIGLIFAIPITTIAGTIAYLELESKLTAPVVDAP